MCGIFGIAIEAGESLSFIQVNKMLNNLFVLSERRGSDSAGMHVYFPQSGYAETLKANCSPRKLLRSKAYRKICNTISQRGFSNNKNTVEQAFIVLAHSRLVTNGEAVNNANNQPVRANQVTMIHNGIVANVDALWKKHDYLERKAQVDTELMAALASWAMDKAMVPQQAIESIYRDIKGAASIAWVHEQTPQLVLATNTGDLYYSQMNNTKKNNGLVFASEEYILEQAIRPFLTPKNNYFSTVVKLMPHSILSFNVLDAAIHHTKNDDETSPSAVVSMNRDYQLVDIPWKKVLAVPPIICRDYDESLVIYDEDRVKQANRCSRCVLPENFPYIAFDEKGVCNYCLNYKPKYSAMQPEQSRVDFIASLDKYRTSGTKPNVLVPFSGGRDSSYGLHLITKEFDFRPITFTYDWGMVTDLSRRNVARMCGELGVENILVSADIEKKRRNIQKNVSAWLKRPDLGMIPLFMAGDKHFFKVVNELKRNTGIKLDLWCANPLENTDFKSGFCKVSPDFDKKRLDYLSWMRKGKMAAHYLKQFMLNPRYLNRSLFDTFQAFMSYYVEPRHDFYFMFDHFIWEENKVNDVLLNQYDWEISPDSTSTWRIGDGTAPFYNYIYNTICGFSEFDTFRSNQIREGMITREEAMASILVENQPRIPSLLWYLETIGLDFNTVIKRINSFA